MSIIYEALKKTEKKIVPPSIEENRVLSVQKKSKKKLILLICLVAVFLSTLGWKVYLYELSIRPKPAKPMPIVKIVKPTPKIKLVLSGVFISDGERLAVINNKTYHLNDTISGMQIISIELEGVRLKNKQQHTIFLRS